MDFDRTVFVGSVVPGTTYYIDFCEQRTVQQHPDAIVVKQGTNGGFISEFEGCVTFVEDAQTILDQAAAQGSAVPGLGIDVFFGFDRIAIQSGIILF